MNGFEFAAGSTIGKDHRTAGRNSQDAHYQIETDDYFIGVVADGCGSGPFNEIGARIGSRLMAEGIASNIGIPGSSKVEFAIMDVLLAVQVLAKRMHGELASNVSDMFLFTLVGTIITSYTATFFAYGDGYISVNDTAIEISFPQNSPPYPSYRLLDGSFKGIANHYGVIAIEDLDNFAIATDGITDYIRSENDLIPGKKDPVGPVSNLWTMDKFYQNEDALNRHLRLINRELVRLDKETNELRPIHGHLADDTTIITGRRVASGTAE